MSDTSALRGCTTATDRSLVYNKNRKSIAVQKHQIDDVKLLAAIENMHPLTAHTLPYRAASAQQELEGSVNGLKKETGAQLRELACDKGEALRALQAAKQAAEQRQHQLQVSHDVALCICKRKRTVCAAFGNGGFKSSLTLQLHYVSACRQILVGRRPSQVSTGTRWHLQQ